MTHFDMQIKILMIGDSGNLRRLKHKSTSMNFSCFILQGVGKTCLLVRYANDSFSPNGLNTIGIDFKIKNLVLERKKIKLQVSHCSVDEQ